MRAWKGPGNVIDAFGLTVDDAEVHGGVHGIARARRAGRAAGVRVRDRHALRRARLQPHGDDPRDARRVYGKELGARAIGRYARRFRFRHPTPDDLLASFAEVIGPDCRAMLEEALFDKGWVDFASKACTRRASRRRRHLRSRRQARDGEGRRTERARRRIRGLGARRAARHARHAGRRRAHARGRHDAAPSVGRKRELDAPPLPREIAHRVRGRRSRSRGGRRSGSL